MSRQAHAELSRLLEVARHQAEALHYAERRPVGEAVVPLDYDHEVVVHVTVRRRRRLGVAS